MESKAKSADGNSSLFFFFSFLFLVHLFFFSLAILFFFYGDNGLLTKGVLLVGEFIKVINAFIIVQASCSWGEYNA